MMIGNEVFIEVQQLLPHKFWEALDSDYIFVMLKINE
jgi:hypothetical protein